MNSSRSNYRRGKPRPQQRSHAPARRVISPDEKKFLAGTAIDPHPRIRLEKGSNELSVRALDLICPIGMGQRALIVSSPGLGKTTFLKHISQAVVSAYPEMKVYCVLVDGREHAMLSLVSLMYSVSIGFPSALYTALAEILKMDDHIVSNLMVFLY